MTDKIQLIIDEISKKANALHHQLVNERTKNDELQTELAKLKEQISLGEKQMEQYITENSDLKSELESAKVQLVESSGTVTENRDEEIDELVKEIEYCISQLKK